MRRTREALTILNQGGDMGYRTRSPHRYQNGGFLAETRFLLSGFLPVVLLVGGSLILTSGIALAQTAQLSGTVRDEQGAVIRAAQVSVTKTDSGAEHSVATGDLGVFVLPFLPPGPYQVTAKAAGFKTTVRQGITLQTGQLLQLDIVLAVGPIQEAVTVSGDTPLLQTESGTVSTAVDRNFVADLPLNGRSFSALYLLAPGVQPTSGPGQYSVNGQRDVANQYSVDGVSANYGVYITATLASTASGGQPATSSTGGTNSLLSVDALQEFQLQTSSYAPEYGRTAGAQVEVVSRSGTIGFRLPAQRGAGRQ
jgi:hypothetical protein